MKKRIRLYHFLSKENGLKALNKQCLKVARIKELNDPFELLAAELSNKKDRQNFHKWKDDVSKKIGFLCFSRNKNNPLLWSHYAKKHCGVALEIEVDYQLAVPVKYRKSRINIDISKIKSNGGFSQNLAEKLGATKSTHWSYEDEVRVPVDLKSCKSQGGLFFESMGSGLNIISITAGPLCKLDPIEVKSQLPKGKEVFIHYSRTAFRSFDVVSNKAKKSTKVKGIG